MNLDETYTLPRAGRYSNPLRSNDRLPIVYGDLTDGSSGNWICPCIDTVNHVYCFAASEVLSVADGNSVSVYADDELVDPANYTFNNATNYESQGTIATITFTADQGNKIISARGKGKASSGVLIENIIDIIDDFLTVENDFSSSDYDATAKATARAKFEAQGYKAAGVIDEDIKAWDLIQKMIGSFLGSVYRNGQGKLVLEIDDGTLSQYGANIVSKADTRFISATQKKLNIVNQCPASYGYDYVKREFRHHTDDSSLADTVSQSIYGVRKPNTPYQFYWCRDLTSVQKIQSIIVDKFANPKWIVEFEDITLKRAHIDVGDIVTATIDNLYSSDGEELYNHLWKVVSVRPDFGKAKIRFRVLDTGHFLTIAYLADGTYKADGSIKAGGDRDTTIY